MTPERSYLKPTHTSRAFRHTLERRFIALLRRTALITGIRFTAGSFHRIIGDGARGCIVMIGP